MESGGIAIELTHSEASLLYEEIATLPLKLLKRGSSRKLLQAYKALESVLSLRRALAGDT